MTGTSGTKEFFAVGRDLKIHKLETLEKYWQSGCFIAYLGVQPILINKGSWQYISDYAGFETKKEAEAFLKTQRELEQALV